MVRSECADRDTVVGWRGPERGRAGGRAAQWHSVERTNSGKADTARHGPVGAGRTDLPACSVRRPWSMVAAGSPCPEAVWPKAQNWVREVHRSGL